MKKSNLVWIFLMLGMVSAAFGQDKELAVQSSQEEDAVEVYYFHMTRRCATCQAVEDETQHALKKYYGDQLEEGTIIFLPVNLEDESNDKLAESLEVSGQSLLVVKGDEIVDLTNDGFKYARSNPDKFYDSIREAIDDMM